MCSQLKALPCLKILGERLFFDISSPSTPTFGGNWHWLLVMDDSNYYSWSFFLIEKSNSAETIFGLINNLKNKYNLQVQSLHCDNASENQAFEWTCKQEGLGVEFEHTPPSMPRQNAHFKQKFATLFNWICTMLNGGKFTTYFQNGLWAKAANTAMLLKNNLITSNRTLSPFQQFFRKGKRSILTLM